MAESVQMRKLTFLNPDRQRCEKVYVFDFFQPLDGFWFSTLILSLVIGRITNYFFQVCDFILSECSV